MKIRAWLSSLVLACLCASHAYAAIGIGVSNQTYVDGSHITGTITSAAASPNVTGSTMYAAAAIETAAPIYDWEIYDSKGNIWTKIANAYNTAGISQARFYCQNCTGGSGYTVTAMATMDGDPTTGGSTTTLVDTAQAWGVNQYVGNLVVVGGQTATVASNTATTLTFTTALSSPVTAGEHYAVGSLSGTATGGSTTTLVDSSKSWATNMWAGFRGIDNTTGIEFDITANTATTLTFSTVATAVSASDSYTLNAGEWSLYFLEITGGATSGILDQNHQNAGFIGSPYSSGNVTTTSANELLISPFTTGYSGSITYGVNSPFSILYSQAVTSPVRVSGAIATRTVSSTGTYASSWTDGSGASSVNVAVDTFIAGASAAPTTTGASIGLMFP